MPADREIDAAARTVPGVRWREDAALLNTVVNLTEFPFAILGNFLLNNIFTFRDRRLKGVRFASGLATFAAISAVGAAANINVSALLFGPAHSAWYVAGFAGAAMSLVWNYAVSSAVTWRR